MTYIHELEKQNEQLRKQLAEAEFMHEWHDYRLHKKPLFTYDVFVQYRERSTPLPMMIACSYDLSRYECKRFIGLKNCSIHDMRKEYIFRAICEKHDIIHISLRLTLSNKRIEKDVYVSHPIKILCEWGIR